MQPKMTLHHLSFEEHAPPRSSKENGGKGEDERAPSERDPFAPAWIGGSHPPPVVRQPARHPAFDRLMSRLPVQTSQSLTADQLVALSLASVPANSPHVIDYRVSVPFFGKRFYVTLLAGRERRSLARLAGEGQLPSVQMFNLNPALHGILLAIVIFGMAMGAYIVKSALGIDLFEGDSAMHEIFRALNDPSHF